MSFPDCSMVPSFHFSLLACSFGNGLHRDLLVSAGCRTVCNAVRLRVRVLSWALAPLFMNLVNHGVSFGFPHDVGVRRVPASGTSQC